MSDQSEMAVSEHKEESMVTYTVVFVLLMVLLGVTYLAYLKDLGATTNLVVAMIIAVTKAAMVLFIFMHVRLNPRIVWVFALSSFLWLILMISGFMQDYGSRGLDGTDAHRFTSPDAAAMQQAGG